MDCTLKRTAYNSDGIFSELFDNSGHSIAVTLEHAYQQPDGYYKSKIPNGTYTCIRGEHQLEGMKQPFTTFEITGVTGHTNILFHMGNYNRDSDGCVLLGHSIVCFDDAGNQMVTNSLATFNEFMAMQNGIDSFTLTVQDE